MSFGNKLGILIEENNLTQKELAAQLNIAPSTLSSYVQNAREPDFDTLKKIAGYFNVSADYLLDIPSPNINNLYESELLRIFRGMTAEHQMLFIEQGKVFLKKSLLAQCCFICIKSPYLQYFCYGNAGVWDFQKLNSAIFQLFPICHTVDSKQTNKDLNRLVFQTCQIHCVHREIF